MNEQAERDEGHRGADEEARPHVLQRARNQDGEGDLVRALSLALRFAPVQRKGRTPGLIYDVAPATA